MIPDVGRVDLTVALLDDENTYEVQEVNTIEEAGEFIVFRNAEGKVEGFFKKDKLLAVYQTE